MRHPPPFTRAREPRRWSPAELSARLGAASLDARLSSGELPFGDRRMATRAAQLLSGSEQRSIAANLRRAVARAGGGAAWTAAVPVSGQAAERDRDALLQLASRLSAADATQARGVARARRLLTDPDSPLFGAADPDSLWAAARDALLALGPTVARPDVVVTGDRAPAPAAPLRH